MLQYHTVDNLITPAPNDCMAQTVNVRSYDEQEIVELMLRRGTSLTGSDLLAVGQLRHEVILDLLVDGCAVNSVLYNMSRRTVVLRCRVIAGDTLFAVNHANQKNQINQYSIFNFNRNESKLF